MNWTRIVLGAVVAGIVVWLGDFVMHGMLLGDTYARYSQVFTQEQANPLSFLAISVAVAFFVAVLFGKSRASWGEGWKGGASFGLFLGLAGYFMNFYYPLVIDGFPYYLAWCWGGVGVIDCVLGGAVLGALIPKE